MSLKSKQQRKSFSFWGRFKEKEEVPRKYDTKKILKLAAVMKKDAELLGVGNVSFAFKDAGIDVYTTYSVLMGNKGEHNIVMPRAINVEYELIDKMSTNEMRSILWHELGHHIFSVYYPSIAKTDDRNGNKVEEAFCDEFAYMKFGLLYVVAYMKIMKYGKEFSKDPKGSYAYGIDRIFPLVDYNREHGVGYWKHLADDLGVEVKYNPGKAKVLLVKPNREILDGLIP
jgi:hypothetical protein